MNDTVLAAAGAIRRRARSPAMALAGVLLPAPAWAADGVQSPAGAWGVAALVIFVLAYCLVISEEKIGLSKSQPVVVAAGAIWCLVAIAHSHAGRSAAAPLLEAQLLEFAELFLFLLAAMTFIDALEERGLFGLLRTKLAASGFSLRQIFWLTGLGAFFLSPIADNLTTALLMATVVTAVGGNNRGFIAVACVNVVVAANAGGPFSPFGDITTLLVWHAGKVSFQEFLVLFVPSLVNWLVVAAILSFAVPPGAPAAVSAAAEAKRGAWVVIGLFLATIALAVALHNFLHLPPVLGMLTGVGLLKYHGHCLRKQADPNAAGRNGSHPTLTGDAASDLDGFNTMRRADWDTLIFFYGIILCVGGIGAFGYLALMSEVMYADLGPTAANILVGLASALIDNIPVMFAVLEMNPDMSQFQWLLVTLTAGVGGSLLSIGSAAGVAVMGQARGAYTFLYHLKWSWAIALGYAASIAVHFMINH